MHKREIRAHQPANAHVLASGVRFAAARWAAYTG